MKVRLEIELDYDDELMYGGDQNIETKQQFWNDIMGDVEGLILYSNKVGDDIGVVRVIRIMS